MDLRICSAPKKPAKSLLNQCLSGRCTSTAFSKLIIVKKFSKKEVMIRIDLARRTPESLRVWETEK